MQFIMILMKSGDVISDAYGYITKQRNIQLNWLLHDKEKDIEHTYKF